MSVLVRWCKFNLVGAMGMVVQLTALASVNRLANGHYLVASACAVEMAVLHNFVWHLHYTWSGGRASNRVFTKLLKFHLSNGAVSLVANLLLMRCLMRQSHVPLLAANGIAILFCSVVNFCLSNGWAFR